MKFFLTGGTGFVGINLAHHLAGMGDDVVIYANQPLLRQAEKMFGNCSGKVSWVCGDVLDKAHMESELLASNADVFIHAAVITPGRERETKQFEQIFRVNTLGAINALEAAKDCGTARFIYVSSVAVYGSSSQEYDPVRETVPLKPSNVYEISKFASEHIALRYRELYNMDVRAIRLGDVFGAWEFDTGVRDTMSAPCQTLKAALERRHAILPKEGMTGWVYVKDVAASIAALAKAAPGQLNHVVYNSSSVYRWSIAQWCDMLAQRYQGFTYEIGNQLEANIKFHALKDNGMFDVSRLREDTGFIPQYDCREAFEDYTNWADCYPDLVGQ